MSKMLTFRFIKELFPFTLGVNDGSIYFRYVTTNHSKSVQKGLYIPLNQIDDTNLLKEAINHGAIAAFWQKDKPIPSYTPNQFPIFLVEDMFAAIHLLMKKYDEYIEQNNEMNEKTIFLISSPLFTKVEENLQTKILGGLHMFKKTKDSLKEGDFKC